jgi:hypothetical protein
MPTFTRAAVDLRWTRAGLFALVCVALAAAGHGLAAHSAVPFRALLAAWLAVTVVAAAFAGRERPFAGIAGVLLAGQLLLHTLFDMSRNGAAGSAHHMSQAELLAGRLLCSAHNGNMTGMHGMSGMSAADAERVVREAGLDPGTVHTAAVPPGMCGTLSSAAPMVVAHVLAALAAGWFLRRGEAALWRLVRLTARAAAVSAFPLRIALALARVLADGLPETVRRPRGAAYGCEPPPLTGLLLQHSVVLRGPPAPLLAA